MRWLILILFFQMHGQAQTDGSKIESADSVDFLLVDKAPEYPGGFAAMLFFLHDKMQGVSDTCDAHGCKRFFVKFMIDTSGVVKDVSVTTNEPQCPALQAELERVYRLLPKWKPGYKNGKAINTYYSLPMRIRLY
jgi:hypothetical protein